MTEESDIDYQVRLECVYKLMRGCMELLTHTAKERLSKTGKETYRGSITTGHDVTNLDYFKEENSERWSDDVKEMMTHDVSPFLLNQYREKKMPVDTVTIKIGDDVLARVIIPCAPDTGTNIDF